MTIWYQVLPNKETLKYYFCCNLSINKSLELKKETKKKKKKMKTKIPVQSDSSEVACILFLTKSRSRAQFLRQTGYLAFNATQHNTLNFTSKPFYQSSPTTV